jgi:hypothetical protein
MDNQRFYPFYERLLAQFPGQLIGKVLVSTLIGLAFLVGHYVSIGNKVFDDWSWFLSVLIITATLCLYYATHILRTLLPEMDLRLRQCDNQVYMPTLIRILSDHNFILAGLFFGLLNSGIGYFFGLPYHEEIAVITILSGYFLAGFVCGMAVFGIYGVSVTIGAFSLKAKPSFDFTSPDRCGGTLFLGEALVEFSLVTLLVGVMISVYILKAKWTGDNTGWIRALKYIWIVFPYVMSLVALIAPAVPINSELRQYKMEQEDELQKQLTKIRENLEDDQIDPAKRKDLHEDYEFQQSVREELHGMRTWPYGVGANIKYLAGVGSSLFASVESASSWMHKIAGQ